MGDRDAGRLVDAALDYAAMGIPVIPLASRDKRPRIKDWKNAASTDPAQIKKWWKQ